MPRRSSLDWSTLKDVAAQGMSCAVNDVALSRREHAEKQQEPAGVDARPVR